MGVALSVLEVADTVVLKLLAVAASCTIESLTESSTSHKNTRI